MPDKSAPAEATLLVRPREAFRILRIGKTLGYELLKAGILERVPLGKRAVGVTMSSVRRVAEGRTALPTPEPKPRFKQPRS